MRARVCTLAGVCVCEKVRFVSGCGRAGAPLQNKNGNEKERKTERQKVGKREVEREKERRIGGKKANRERQQDARGALRERET